MASNRKFLEQHRFLLKFHITRQPRLMYSLIVTIFRKVNGAHNIADIFSPFLFGTSCIFTFETKLGHSHGHIISLSSIYNLTFKFQTLVVSQSFSKFSQRFSHLFQSLFTENM